MRILVTGGAGYIGSVVADQLLQAGHKVTIYDNLYNGHRAAVPGGAEFVEGDLAEATKLDQLLENGRTEAVMHFAALIEAGESMRDPGRFFAVNTSGAINLLRVMQKNGVSKFVFSSTAAVYGEPQQVPIAEDHRLVPTNAYGESKLLVERILAWFHRIHGLHYASLRYFNAAGATSDRGEEHRRESHLIPLVLQAASGKREQIAIFGDDYPTPDGTCVRDYIHVSDLASAHLLALDALAQRDCLIYNLGNGRGFTVKEVIDAARKVTGREIKATVQPRRAGDPAVLVASSERIQKELGWKPKLTSLEQIVGSAWEWHRSHPNGYK
ncbi:MAG TPA: UDP-glucose 4-epimerase GalE [candidate division Zixibacteria bacterium]|nr:UDP-glucose 4-epimerase GalE [candidate division Zixibacteria bacterium]